MKRETATRIVALVLALMMVVGVIPAIIGLFK
ncbi:Uncharacterised protein [Parvimonas micra]|jgi:hypothetical protein|uniref:DUF4044 domain-containing protein n=1 Tax=Parvimonas micra ATCC 33270 TaxID=411465 RepID=A8SLN7_9FIRM|nr:hypothetical protein PEPMIC_01053 [Parvimonas micra ATCC 33270]VEH97685.1 Uncharacterised protein [Parvimonas micra]